MNSWNSAEVHASYPSQSLGFFTQVSEDRVNLNDPAVGFAIRGLVEKENADPQALSTVEKARAIVAAIPASEKPQAPYPTPEFGFMAQWVSEVGDPKTLSGLLKHADTFMNPTWKRGGLYYSRNYDMCDKDGNWTLVDPYTGNGAIGYARLNVYDGQKKMWEKPWTAEDFASRPFVDGVDLSGSVDFLRGAWDPESGAMVVTLRTWDGSSARSVFLQY